MEHVGILVMSLLLVNCENKKKRIFMQISLITLCQQYLRLRLRLRLSLRVRPLVLLSS